MFREKDLKPQNLKCGVSDSSNFAAMSQLMKPFKRSRRSTVFHGPYRSNEKSRYVELIIVNDNKEYKELKGDKNAVFQRSKEIANIVNGLYAPLNIFIALVGVIIWSDHDEIKLSTDGDATLTNFLHYRKEKLAQEHPNDNAQLITAMTFDGGVVGKALKGPICTYEYSGGVNMDHSHVVGLVATTIAHELGHNFGMEHDTDACQCPDDKCIMAPSSSSTTPYHWSSCSLEYIELAYAQGMDYCLKNPPVDIIGPVCGNGFLEKGEECDCGLKDFCDNRCCNATSCQLYPNATCATGACCNLETCQVKKIASICRNTISECDLPEYCDGISEFCPTDTFHQNGKECSKGKAFCYDGHCQSHMDQCKLLWGHTGKTSDLKCFEQNYRGNVNGNCGYNRINQTYKACRKEDILCGMLHCTHLNERLEFGMESAAILARSYINVKGKTFTCRSAIVDLGLFNMDPGLVPNGAKCGHEKVCVNQKCIPVSSIKNGECLYDCNGNGVCNNKGNCHCDKGYSPPYCISHGPGGSVDSGPPSDPNNYFVIISMYVVFLGLLPLMLFSSLTIYYYRSHIKVWWSKRAHKATIKSREKTTTQRKVQPPSKFSFDKTVLRTLEISEPIHVLPSASTNPHFPATLPCKTSKNTADESNLRQGAISFPIPELLGNINVQKSKLVPVRPSPPRPDNVPQRAPSWSSQAATALSSVAKSSSFRDSCDKGGVYKPQNSSFRPSCPPPRPPPPPPSKTQPILKEENQSYIYEQIRKNSDEQERSTTPSSAYYDDCQELHFSEATLPNVHKLSQSKEDNSSEKFYKTTFQEQSRYLADESNIKLNAKCQMPNSNKAVISQTLRSGDNSLVAALTQKFEKQENNLNKTFNSNISAFKFRPLPPRPGDTEV